MELGYLSGRLTPKFIIFFFLQFLFVLVLFAHNTWQDMGDECLRCHSDKQRMSELGYPALYMSKEDVESQSKHRHVRCQGCHLGKARETDKDIAHMGMLKPIFVSHKGEGLNRKDIGLKDALLPYGEDKIRLILPKIIEGDELIVHPEVRNILWHDRDLDTYNFSPDTAKKTCGASGCHPDELRQFNSTTMGTNMRQRTMRTWLEPYGPHNCGPSFADQPPKDVLKDVGFDFKNTADIQREINLPFSREQAKDKQRFCNLCHAGCLDCHYAPDKSKGVHNMVNKPSSESCSGYGRGTSMCHPGAMQSRRGETYIGGDYSIPTGMESDSHYKKDIHCVDCHHTGRGGMGDMVRKAGCQDCHVEIEDAHSRGIHKRLDCASCHVNELRGYQLVVWGPGKVADRQNPFKKYSLYYGIQRPPILMKDQTGQWMPVKIMPHSLGNFSKDVPPSGDVRFRWLNGETRDGYYIIGAFDGPANNKHLLWMELQQASHPYGKARDCESCHRDAQMMQSVWQYMDYQGAESPFQGGYRVTADKKGLKVQDMSVSSPIKAAQGYKIEDFASWVHFKDKWFVPGDFSIKTDKAKYKRYVSLSKDIKTELKGLERAIINKGVKIKKAYRDVRAAALHNEDDGAELISRIKKDIR